MGPNFLGAADANAEKFERVRGSLSGYRSVRFETPLQRHLKVPAYSIQHFLNFRPLPHGQGEFRPNFRRTGTSSRRHRSARVPKS
jgi:hypothetical protein